MKFDVIVIGGGTAGMTAATELAKAGLTTAVISAGHSLFEVDYEAYKRLGGNLFMGDCVTGGEFEADRLIAVRTANLGDYSLEADDFIIATGKFLGKGLVADMDCVYEPLFGLDTSYLEDRTRWFSRSFAEPQPFLSFGVMTDGCSRPSVGGRTISNLYAAGELLEDVTSVGEGAEAAIRETAMKVVGIIKEKHHAGA